MAGLKDKPVVTCFLRHRGEVLLLRRSGEAGSYRGRWGGVSGYIETDEPDRDARREIREETGLPGEVPLVRRGAPFQVDDPRLGVRWHVHPYLFESPQRALRLNEETTEAAWVAPTEILRRETVPDLWTSYTRVAPTVASIRQDTTHGSAWLSLRALEVLRDRAGVLACEQTPSAWDELADLARTLQHARPSMTALCNRVNRVMHACRADASAAAVEREAHRAIQHALQADDEAARQASGYGAGRRVVTLSRSGTVLDALLRADPPPARILVPESRPGGEGVSVAEELASHGLNVLLMPDAAVAQVFEQEMADVVLVGADTVLRSGHIVNKVGTLHAAMAARQHHVPCYAVAASDKVRIDDTIVLEQGAADFYSGPALVEVFSPVFEVIPARWLSGIITEDGVLAPVDVQDVAFELQALMEW